MALTSFRQKAERTSLLFITFCLAIGANATFTEHSLFIPYRALHWKRGFPLLQDGVRHERRERNAKYTQRLRPAASLLA